KTRSSRRGKLKGFSFLGPNFNDRPQPMSGHCANIGAPKFGVRRPGAAFSPTSGECKWRVVENGLATCHSHSPLERNSGAGSPHSKFERDLSALGGRCVRHHAVPNSLVENPPPLP